MVGLDHRAEQVRFLRGVIDVARGRHDRRGRDAELHERIALELHLQREPDPALAEQSLARFRAARTQDDHGREPLLV